jgi:hypothetical protein
LTGNSFDATRAMGYAANPCTLQKHCLMRLPLRMQQASGKRVLIMCSKGAARAFGSVGQLARFWLDPLQYLRTAFYKKNGRWDVDCLNIVGAQRHAAAVTEVQQIVNWKAFISFLVHTHAPIIETVCRTNAADHADACTSAIQWLSATHPVLFPSRSSKAVATIAVQLAVLMGCTDNASVILTKVPYTAMPPPPKGLAVAHAPPQGQGPLPAEWNGGGYNYSDDPYPRRFYY